MRKLAIALGLTAAVMVAGSFGWRAEATTLSSGAVHLPTAAKNYSPVEKAGCFAPAGVDLAGFGGAADGGAGACPASLTLLAA
jgi:hypothetical protein